MEGNQLRNSLLHNLAQERICERWYEGEWEMQILLIMPGINYD